MLVALRRINGLPDGRLAVIKHPVGWVKELLGAPRKVFAWQVLLTGDPVQVHGRTTQELIVADSSLMPVSHLQEAQQQVLQDGIQQREIDEGVALIQSMLKPGDMESPEFEKALHLAHAQALMRRMLETVGVQQALLEMGFWPENPPDGQSLVWLTVFNGQEIQMGAGPGMFRDWRIWVRSGHERRMSWGERVALNDWPRGKVAQVVLELWEGVFGNSRIPEQMELGWAYRQHQNDIKALDPVLPNVHLDGGSLRRALRWLREAYVPDTDLEGPPRDVRLDLDIRDGLLRLSTDLYDIGVAVHRGWMDPCAVSLRQLLALPWATVRGHWLRMECSSQGCLLNGQSIGYWPDLDPKIMSA
jgi:hypothetical protein